VVGRGGGSRARTCGGACGAAVGALLPSPDSSRRSGPPLSTCRGDFPYLLTASTVEVDDPATEGTELVTISNPFYGYTMPVGSGATSPPP
jgi:hypothetical protein